MTPAAPKAFRATTSVREEIGLARMERAKPVVVQTFDVVVTAA